MDLGVFRLGLSRRGLVQEFNRLRGTPAFFRDTHKVEVDGFGYSLLSLLVHGVIPQILTPTPARRYTHLWFIARAQSGRLKQ